MKTPTTVNIADVIDNHSIGAFQVGLFALCAACLIMDGFDVQAVGYTAPEIIRQLHISASHMAPVTTAGLVGVLVGSLLFSIVADRIGRRPVLIAATFCFSILTLLTGRAQSVAQLVAIRFLAGVGLGGIMPNVVALVGEYSPRRLRVFLMVLISNGFNVGAMSAGFIAARLMPEFGWPSVFYFGGVIPLLIGVLMLFALPESLQFLALRGERMDAVGRWLRRIDPNSAALGAAYVIPEKPERGGPLVHLFREGRATGTTLLWIINFMNLLNLYFLSSWLTTVFRDAGYSLTNAVYIGTTLQAGGTIGTLVLGWLVGRRGFDRILPISFAVACVSIGLIGQPALSVGFLFVTVFVAGFCVLGGQGALNALAATFYPTDLRSTGIGFALGVGRLGAIVGQPIAGLLLAHHWAARELFLAAALPALIATVAMFSLRWFTKLQASVSAGQTAAIAH